MMIWKKKSNTWKLKQFIENFSLFIKQCYRNVWSVNKRESKTPKIVKTKNEWIMLLSKCAVRDSRKSRFIKEQEDSGLLSSLEIRTPLSKTPLVGSFLF